MAMANATSRAGQRDVEPFVFESALLLALGDGGFQSVKSSLDLDLDLIGDAAEFRALFFRKLAEVLKFESKKTGLAGQIPGAGVF